MGDPSNIVREVHLLYPDVYQKLNKVLTEANALGLNIYPFETFRTQERQFKLLSEKATKTAYSWHLFGLAVDLYPKNERGFMGGKDLDNWYASSKANDLVKIAEKEGFSWGGRWTRFVDKPHFEITYGIPKETLIPMIGSGLNIIWQAINKWRKVDK